MPQSIADIHLHIVFSTFNRRNYLADETLRRGVHAYLAGILGNKHCPAIVIGGTSDHVHILCELARTISVADLVKETKRASTIWIKGEGRSDFGWQSGYGAFAVGRPQIEVTKAYVANQEEHHRKKTFQEEYRELLTAHEQSWDERYVWD